MSLCVPGHDSSLRSSRHSPVAINSDQLPVAIVELHICRSSDLYYVVACAGTAGSRTTFQRRRRLLLRYVHLCISGAASHYCDPQRHRRGEPVCYFISDNTGSGLAVLQSGRETLTEIQQPTDTPLLQAQGAAVYPSNRRMSCGRQRGLRMGSVKWRDEK